MAKKIYIELQKALNVCEMHYEHCLEMHDWSGDATADDIKRDIETIPTADVAEVKRGHYVRNDRNIPKMKEFHEKGVALSMNEKSIFYTCSECGEWISLSQKYCSECGAIMDIKTT